MGDENVPSNIFVKAVHAMSSTAVADEVERAGLDGRAFQSSPALEVALSTPDAGARWARGERFFDAAHVPGRGSAAAAPVRAALERHRRRQN